MIGKRRISDWPSGRWFRIPSFRVRSTETPNMERRNHPYRVHCQDVSLPLFNDSIRVQDATPGLQLFVTRRVGTTAAINSSHTPRKIQFSLRSSLPKSLPRPPAQVSFERSTVCRRGFSIHRYSSTKSRSTFHALHISLASVPILFFA